MLSGELYLASDAELVADDARARALVEQFNATSEDEREQRDALLRQLFGSLGEGMLAKGLRTVGVGAGQMSRVISVQIACEKAGAESQGSVLASDAFFPFPDGVEAAIAHGVTAIAQPGGSKKDPEILAAADKAGVAMVLTGVRHFRH